MRARKWVALGVTVAVMLAASLAFGENTTPCYEAYLTSGLTHQQMSFEEFRELYSVYSHDVCAISEPRSEGANAHGGTQK